MGKEVNPEIRELSKNPSFCVLPWVHLATGPQDYIRACCFFSYENEPAKKTQDKSLESYLNSQEFENIRQAMLKGEKIKGCKACYIAEENGKSSYRQNSNNNFSHISLEKPKLKYLELALENTCNLRCRTCKSLFSSKLYKEEVDLNTVDMPFKSFRFDLESLKLNPKELEVLRLIGGEPFLFKDHIRLLQMLEEDLFHIHLEYTTNLTIFPEEAFQYWAKAKKLKIIVSIDALGELNNYIRKDSSFEVITSNLRKLVDRLEQVLKGKYEIIIQTTVSIFNINKILEFDKFFNKEFPQITLIKEAVINPPKYCISNLPYWYKEKLIDDFKAVEKFSHFYSYLIGILRSPQMESFSSFVVNVEKVDKYRGDELEKVNKELFDVIYRYKSENEINNLSEKIASSKVFCSLPWIHLTLVASGDITPCCRHTESIKESGEQKSLQHYLSSEPMEKLRNRMLNEEKTAACNQCYEEEESGVLSRRQMANNFKHLVNLDNPKPKYLELALENICNLKCRTCSSKFSTKWYKEEELIETNHERKKPHKFELDKLEIDYSELRAVRLVGGEPFLFGDHLKFLKNAAPYASRISLDYNTNLTILSDELFSYWKDYERLNFTVSVDGLGKLNDYIRKGSRFEDVMENLKKLTSYYEKNPHRNLFIAVHTTVNSYNVHQLPEMDDFFEKNFPNVRLSKSCLTTPKRLSIQNLPQTYKDRIKKLLLPRTRGKRGEDYTYILNLLAKPPQIDFNKFHEWNSKLDKIRGEDWQNVAPENFGESQDEHV